METYKKTISLVGCQLLDWGRVNTNHVNLIDGSLTGLELTELRSLTDVKYLGTAEKMTNRNVSTERSLRVCCR